MKFVQKSAVLIGVLAASAMAQAPSTCPTPPWGQCKAKDGPGLTCCPDGYYCMPWDSGNSQCRPVPAQCERIITNVDFPGNDIQTVYGIQPEKCCEVCASTKDCAAYTYINNPNGPPGTSACYLKRAGGSGVSFVGAVSGYVKGGQTTSAPSPQPTGATPAPSPQPTGATSAPSPQPGNGCSTNPPPANGCSTSPWGKCGDEKGSVCCPSGQYCQPWSPNFYQCMQTPAKCPTQLTDIDFPGNDIGKARAGNGEECCNACAANKDCKAYTFINFNNDGPQCYLKNSAGNGNGTRKVGAVSGKL